MYKVVVVSDGNALSFLCENMGEIEELTSTIEEFSENPVEWSITKEKRN